MKSVNSYYNYRDTTTIAWTVDRFYFYNQPVTLQLAYMENFGNKSLHLQAFLTYIIVKGTVIKIFAWNKN
jgi:hypothetical protein